MCLLFLAVLLASCSRSRSGETTESPEHEHIWDEGTVTREGSCDPETKEETKGEVLYTCTVCGATKAEETDGHTYDLDHPKVVAQATCKQEGVIVYTCTVCKAIGHQESIPINPDAHVVNSGDLGRIASPPTASRNGKLEKICSACGAGVYYDTVTYDDYIAKVNALQTQVTAFTTAQFGGTSITDTRQEMIDASGETYSLPPVNPTKGQHPRVLITRADRAGINAEITNLRNTTAVKKYLSYLAKPAAGELGAARAHGSDIDNFSADTLYNIQAQALEYQLTGNKIAGYGAILGIKNYILTLDIQKIVVDQERNYGFVMYIAACVYDWCYDLLSTTDKLQIVSGVEHKIVSGSNSYGVKMEIGFPPSKQGAISGHGSEFQLLRDYLAFAIAIYDEYPGWWEYIGGRFYAEFIPVRNEYYKAGMYPQGVSVYVRVRYAADLYSAWLIKSATGSIPYDDPNGMKQVMRTLYSYELPNDNAFESGDNNVNDDIFQDYGRLALISSYLFGDSTIRAELEYHRKSYSSFSETITMSATVAEYLICSNGVTTAARRHTDMPLIQYNGGWLGQIIARNNWSDNQASVLMKIGCRTMANHDHADAGQFQIWYKTMLAGDTGAYDKYGDTHFKKYHQATIAHNSLLIGGSGQKQPSETGSFSSWKTSDIYKTGTVNGYAWGYADAAQTKPTYAYIAGNITPAYNGAASEVTRRMLAVYDTQNENVPLYFFVFDNITTGSTSTKKTFLLHVPVEPTVSGNTVTVTKNGAKLVLQSVIGGDNITTVGGVGNNYNVNGTQINPTNNGNDGFWGRVEISPNTGSKTNQLLNVMYVADASKTLMLQATAISNDTVKGAKIGKVAAVFVTGATRRETAFSFSAAGSGDLTYYVSGVKAGNWTVSAGGSTQTVTATEDGGLLVFTAPAGTVTLTLQ